MGLTIDRSMTVPAPGLIADRRLCVTADRGRVVEERDPDAAFLLAGAGGMISADDVARYHLIRDTDGRVVVALAGASGPAADPAKDPKAKPTKAKPAADA